MKLLKTILVWVLALQILNMSMWSEAYNSYYSGDDFGNCSNEQVDPTETIVEWIVEMKMGQQDAFTYNHNIDCKSIYKAAGWQVYLENHCVTAATAMESSLVFYPHISPALQHVITEIQSPPPDQNFYFKSSPI